MALDSAHILRKTFRKTFTAICAAAASVWRGDGRKGAESSRGRRGRKGARRCGAKLAALTSAGLALALALQQIMVRPGWDAFAPRRESRRRGVPLAA